MDQRTLTALEGSIAKWQAIADGTGADRGMKNCPLCLEFAFNRYMGSMCQGCPVAERSGKKGCLGTPYEAWRDEQHLLDGLTQPVDPRLWLAVTPELVWLARAELDFLKSLLPRSAS